ncbi:MAG: hypothetical protein JW913_18720 [Chitinispirillaceae bacterium]|nr:hypothetical protein [Chitinispirillaceae bacterium]
MIGMCMLLLWQCAGRDCRAEDSIRYTADVSRLPVGTDIAAMGDAGVVLPRRATATIWNPAAAAFLKRYEFSMEGADLYQRLSQQGCFAGTAPLQNNLGAVLSYQPFYSGRILQYDTIPESPVNGMTSYQPTGFIRNYQHLVICALARNFPLRLPRFPGTDLPLPLDISIGGNLKAYAQTMSPSGLLHIGMGYNVDLGLQTRIGLDFDVRNNEVRREVWLGATIRDVLPSDVIWIYARDDKLMYSPENYREPFHYAQYYGVAFVDRSGDLFADWTVALSLHKEYEVTYHGGIEAEFWNTALFRIGFSGRTPTLGAGLRYRRFFIDYAFRFEEIALSFIRLTVGISLPAAPRGAAQSKQSKGTLRK